MSISLRRALCEMMDGWKEDLDPEWRGIMGEVEPDLNAVDSCLQIEVWEPIFPSRKRLLGADNRANLFQAFNRISPQSVKIVIVGQDPYPNIARATGRSFEPGNLGNWQYGVPKSLQNIVRVAAFAQTSCASYLTKKWERIVEDISCRRLRRIPLKPRDLFDKWEKSGVLWLNTGLTMTRYQRGGHPHQQKWHIPYWKPVIERVCHYLAERQTGVVVFVLWGTSAKQFFINSGIKKNAIRMDTWHKQISVVCSKHPSHNSFLRESNPFDAINTKLRDMGKQRITW